ncbi:DEAD/DEAH box helicase family protein [Candidatus Parcubacteria bacterium]|nr:DEAD/DEAH box helicase family protein [Candidatus Parcubacteria bacterium]
MPTDRLKFDTPGLLSHFPLTDKITVPRPIQRDAMRALAEGKWLQQLPTGTGKTALEYAAASYALSKLEPGETVVWIAPSRAVVAQIKEEHPDVRVVFGQHDHVCPWAHEGFEEEPKNPVQRHELPVLAANPDVPRVDEVPYMFHKNCPHYVDQKTGQVKDPSAVPCPYYQQTYEAKKGGGIVVMTMSAYTYIMLFGNKQDGDVYQTAYGRVPVLIVDEAHQWPDVIRYTLSYTISNYHVSQAIALLERIHAPEAPILRRFLEAMNEIAHSEDRQPDREYLLEGDQIEKLLEILDEIEPGIIEGERRRAAIEAGHLKMPTDFRAVRDLERLTRDLRRYGHTMRFGIPVKNDDDEVIRRPLNYTCSFFQIKKGRERVEYLLRLHCHYVAGLIIKRLAPPTTLCFSATIGQNADHFRYETGLRLQMHSAPSPFPATNRRIMVPCDVDDLSRKQDMSGKKKRRTLRAIANGCARLAEQDIRSLVLLVSNKEREQCIAFCEQAGLEVVTYNGHMPAKEAARLFKDGQGQVLIGCMAHYGTGLDLPDGLAGALWLLRPGYPDPESAVAQFEQQRYGKGAWVRTRARVVLQTLQALGRNIRSKDCKGVSLLMSEGFRELVFHNLPPELQAHGVYIGDRDLEECLGEAEDLLVD